MKLWFCYLKVWETDMCACFTCKRSNVHTNLINHMGCFSWMSNFNWIGLRCWQQFIMVVVVKTKSDVGWNIQITNLVLKSVVDRRVQVVFRNTLLLTCFTNWPVLLCSLSWCPAGIVSQSARNACRHYLRCYGTKIVRPWRHKMP